jgi:hypothetical protein
VKRWFLARLIIIPAVLSLATCIIILPLFSALRNYILYNYFPVDTFWADVPFLLLLGFAPLFAVLLLFTALGLWIYMKVKKRL